MGEPESGKMTDDKPSRVKLEFKTARALLDEHARSMEKGGCTIEAAEAMPKGSRITFEMNSPCLQEPIEVIGEVVGVTQAQEGGPFSLEIRYGLVEDERSAFRRTLERIFRNHRYERQRKHPRIPVNLATDANDATRQYLMRDVSLGGMGFVILGEGTLPTGVAKGSSAVVSIEFDQGSTMDLKGTVAWACGAVGDLLEARVGVQFGELTEGTKILLNLFIRTRASKAIRVALG